jgi:cell division protein FtsB
MSIFKKKLTQPSKQMSAPNPGVTIENERRNIFSKLTLTSAPHTLDTTNLEDSNSKNTKSNINNNNNAKNPDNASNQNNEDSTFNSDESKKFKKNIEEIKLEYEKKFKKLTSSVEAKAEESVRLQCTIKEQEKQMKTLKQENESLKQENEKLKKVWIFRFKTNSTSLYVGLILNLQELQNMKVAKQDSDSQIEDLIRRINVLSDCLEEMAQENLTLRDQVKHVSLKPQKSSKQSTKLTVEYESIISNLEIRIKYLEYASPSLLLFFQHILIDPFLIDCFHYYIVRKFTLIRVVICNSFIRDEVRSLQSELEIRKSRIKTLEEEVITHSQKYDALLESIDEYEEKIAKLELKMKESLKKEAKRRHKIQYHLARYKVLTLFSLSLSLSTFILLFNCHLSHF